MSFDRKAEHLLLSGFLVVTIKNGEVKMHYTDDVTKIQYEAIKTFGALESENGPVFKDMPSGLALLLESPATVLTFIQDGIPIGIDIRYKQKTSLVDRIVEIRLHMQIPSTLKIAEAVYRTHMLEQKITKLRQELDHERNCQSHLVTSRTIDMAYIKSEMKYASIQVWIMFAFAICVAIVDQKSWYGRLFVGYVLWGCIVLFVGGAFLLISQIWPRIRTYVPRLTLTWS
jgi:hypothetical protein